MADVRTFEAGNYKFVNGAFMYSAGDRRASRFPH